jgi:hypothetical protein
MYPSSAPNVVINTASILRSLHHEPNPQLALHMKQLLNNLLKLQDFEFGDDDSPAAKTQIAALRAKIPAPVLAHFERMTKRGKKGVALVHHQTCTECYMRVPIGNYHRLMHATDLTLCDSCGCYLHLPEEELATLAPGAEFAAHR